MASIFRVPKRTPQIGEGPQKSRAQKKVVKKIVTAVFLKSWNRVWYPAQRGSQNTTKTYYFMLFGVLFRQLFTGLAKIPPSYLKSSLSDSTVAFASKKPLRLDQNSTLFAFLLLSRFFYFFDGSHRSFQDPGGALFGEKRKVSSALLFCSQNAPFYCTLAVWYPSESQVEMKKSTPNNLLILEAKHRGHLENRKKQKYKLFKVAFLKMSPNRH